jgi:hypothetical protein
MSLDEYVYHLSLDVLSKEIGKYDASKLNEIYISHFNSEFFFFFFFFYFWHINVKSPKESVVQCLLFHLESRSKNYNSKQIKKHTQMKPYLTILGRTDVVISYWIKGRFILPTLGSSRLCLNFKFLSHPFPMFTCYGLSIWFDRIENRVIRMKYYLPPQFLLTTNVTNLIT